NLLSTRLRRPRRTPTAATCLKAGCKTRPLRPGRAATRSRAVRFATWFPTRWRPSRRSGLPREEDDPAGRLRGDDLEHGRRAGGEGDRPRGLGSRVAPVERAAGEGLEPGLLLAPLARRLQLQVEV